MKNTVSGEKSETRRDIHTDGTPVVCKACEARHRGICGALNPDQLVQLSKHAHLSAVPRGQALMDVGDDIDTCSNIIGGVVKLTKLLGDGREQIVGLQYAPDFLGTPQAQTSAIAAEATTDVRLCSFPKRTLERIAEETPELKQKLLEQTLKQLNEATDWMVTLGRKTATEKVASFLCLVADNIDPEHNFGDAISFSMPLSRREMADFLGLTVETVSRQITRLRKQGLVEVPNNMTIKIVSLGKLRVHAG